LTADAGKNNHEEQRGKTMFRSKRDPRIRGGKTSGRCSQKGYSASRLNICEKKRKRTYHGNFQTATASREKNHHAFMGGRGEKGEEWQGRVLFGFLSEEGPVGAARGRRTRKIQVQISRARKKERTPTAPLKTAARKCRGGEKGRRRVLKRRVVKSCIRGPGGKGRQSEQIMSEKKRVKRPSDRNARPTRLRGEESRAKRPRGGGGNSTSKEKARLHKTRKRPGGHNAVARGEKKIRRASPAFVGGIVSRAPAAKSKLCALSGEPASSPSPLY